MYSDVHVRCTCHEIMYTHEMCDLLGPEPLETVPLRVNRDISLSLFLSLNRTVEGALSRSLCCFLFRTRTYLCHVTRSQGCHISCLLSKLAEAALRSGSSGYRLTFNSPCYLLQLYHRHCSMLAPSLS